MTNDIEIKLHRPSIKCDLKGRITRPIVGIQSSEFVYVPAIKTNLAETFKKARERLAKEAA